MKSGLSRENVNGFASFQGVSMAVVSRVKTGESETARILVHLPGWNTTKRENGRYGSWGVKKQNPCCLVTPEPGGESKTVSEYKRGVSPHASAAVFEQGFQLRLGELRLVGRGVFTTFRLEAVVVAEIVSISVGDELALRFTTFVVAHGVVKDAVETDMQVRSAVGTCVTDGNIVGHDQLTALMTVFHGRRFCVGGERRHNLFV